MCLFWYCPPPSLRLIGKRAGLAGEAQLSGVPTDGKGMTGWLESPQQ